MERLKNMNMIVNPNELKNIKNKLISQETVINLGGIKIVNDRLVFVNDIDLIDLIEEEEFNKTINKKPPFVNPKINIDRDIIVNQNDRRGYQSSHF